jgi:acetyl esterase/lipase
MEEGEALPAAIGLISPATDLKVVGDTAFTIGDADPFINLDESRSNIAKYAGNTPRNQPLMSPVYGNLEGFPPLLIQVGTREVLLSDAVRLARAAREAEVDVTLDVWEGMWHAWHMAWPDVPEARQACKEMGRFLKKHIIQ